MFKSEASLPPQDVREQFNAFITEHPNGKMKKKDFGEMMKKVKVFRHQLGETFSLKLLQALPQRDDADKMEKHMFRVYDANDDGYVDFVEFMVSIPSWKRKQWIFSNIQMIFYIMSDGSPEEVLAKIFRVFDVNRWPDHQIIFSQSIYS